MNATGQLVEVVVFAIMICSTMIGINRGMFLGIFAVVQKIIILAATLGAAPVITRSLPETVQVARQGFGYGIALIVSMIVVAAISKLIKFMNDMPVLGLANRIGGAILGFVVGFLIIWCLFALIGTFQEYSWCKEMVKVIRENNRLMWIQDTSPLTYFLEMMGFPVL